MTTEVFDPANLVSRDDQREDIRAYVIERHAQGASFSQIHREIAGIYAEITLRQWVDEDLDWRSKTPPPLPTSTIIGCFGRRGSGKTLLASWLGWDAYLAGRPVIYNPRGLLKFPPIEGRICEFMSLKQIAMMDEGLKGALLILDEIQINLSKYRSSTTASLLLRRVIQQTRKIGVDLIVTSNSPGELDASFGPQLDIYGMCKAYFPPQYPGQDAVGVQWVDAQKQFGVGAIRSVRGSYIDNRIRRRDWLWPASKMFALFDTTVAVDPMEVMGLTSEEMRQSMMERDLGVTVKELIDWTRETLVPDLVEAGIESIQPASLVSWIAETYSLGADHAECCGSLSHNVVGAGGCDRGKKIPLILSADTFGTVCKQAGLHGIRRAAGMIYKLPPAEALGLWQKGMWTEDAA